MTDTRTVFEMLTCVIVAVLALMVTISTPASAHEMQPTVVDMKIADDGGVTLKFTANLEAMIAGIGPEHDNAAAAPQADEYNRLRTLLPDDLKAAFQQSAVLGAENAILTLDGAPLSLAAEELRIPPVGDTAEARSSELVFTTQLPAGGGELTWNFPGQLGESVLRLYHSGLDAPFHAVFVPSGQTETVTLDETLVPSGKRASIAEYIQIGFAHIVPKGLDHVLFIIGLFLLNPAWRPLLMQVTTFTLAHSVTLALGLLGLVNLPGSIVEPLIAASIAFVAVENIFTRKLHRWRIFVVFLFGLLHGLGFAGVLREYAATGKDLFTSLLGFNIGVELGQIAVVAVCYLLVGIWFGHRRWYHARIVVPASLVIALISGYWFVERIVA